MKKQDRHEIEEMLPWYASSTLPPEQMEVMRAELIERPELAKELEDWRGIQAVVQSQPRWSPPDRVWQSIQKQITAAQPNRGISARPVASWWAGLVLAIMVLVGLWYIVQPGIVLQWTVSGQSPETYRIYRAPSGTADFQLIHEIKAQDEISYYRYVDTLLLPGQSFSYRVEGVGQVGRIAVSQMVTIPPLAALPGQLAVILTSLAAGYCAVMLFRIWPLPLARRWPGILV